MLATMLAVVTTDYPLEPGEAIEFLRPAVDTSFNAISVDGECSTNDTVILLANGASGIERTPATDAEFAALRPQRLRRAREADRRRRRRRDRARRDRSARCGERVAGARDRRARRDLAAREDGALRARRELGPHRRRRRLREVQRRLRASSTRTCSRSRSTASPVLVAGRPTGDEPALLERPLRDRHRPRARRRRGDLPDHRPLVRLRAINAEYRT